MEAVKVKLEIALYLRRRKQLKGGEQYGFEHGASAGVSQPREERPN